LEGTGANGCRMLSDSVTQRVLLTPPYLMQRRFAQRQSVSAEIIDARERVPFDYRFKSDRHLLIMAEQAARDDGETLVEGLARSTLREFSGKLTFVPAGHAFHGWQDPRILLRATYFYIDPHDPLLGETLAFAGVSFQPRLFFADSELWRVAAKLRDDALVPAGLASYADALTVLLGHALMRVNASSPPALRASRGGLTGRQQKRVAEFIEEHLAENVRLASLAGLAGLSPYHFARAFKQSFGAPPHRYHIGRRIARAKTLLEAQSGSVTEVAVAVGFAETSSFSAAFRRFTGIAPSDYRRGLD
jgi:AraC family transcriptional regulator